VLNEATYNVLATVSLLMVAPPLWTLRRVTRSTTMSSAADWSVVAFVGWSLALAVDWLSGATETRWSDQLWYTACVLTLTPFTAALGAKRPGTRVWSVFVIVPLILVLEWPAVSHWDGTWPPGRLVLESPALAAMGLVLVMGTGNYLGTRYAWPVLGIACGIPLLLAPLSEHAFHWAFPAEFWRATACGCLALSILRIRWKSARRPPQTGLERVWTDFRDLYGIAWARRVQEQINTTAHQEHWTIRLDFQGLVQESGAPADTLSALDMSRIERALRWSLRRFVDPGWITARLGSQDLAATTPDSGEGIQA